MQGTDDSEFTTLTPVVLDKVSNGSGLQFWCDSQLDHVELDNGQNVNIVPHVNNGQDGRNDVTTNDDPTHTKSNLDISVIPNQEFYERLDQKLLHLPRDKYIPTLLESD